MTCIITFDDFISDAQKDLEKGLLNNEAKSTKEFTLLHLLDIELPPPSVRKVGQG